MRFVSATVLNIKSPTLKSGDAYCLLPNVCNAQPPWWVMALTDHKTCTFYGCLPNNANVERSLLITSVLHSTPACFIQSSGPLDFGVSLQGSMVSLLEELERWSPFLAPARALHMTMINYRRFLQNLYPFKAAAHELQPKRNQKNILIKNYIFIFKC